MTLHAQEQTLDAQLAAERAHLDTSRAALRRMRERAEALFATGDKVAGDAYTAEQLGRHMARRVKELADDPTTPLFFGRLDFGHTDPDHAGREYHVGRRHVTDERGEPLVLDWRAPVSRSFYRASARDPQGVAVRRRFGFSGGALTSFEDERSTGARNWARPVGSSPPRSSARASARCATSSPPSSPSRTNWSGPTWPTRSACRARRAPARRPSGCTGPRTCSTCTGSGCAARGC
nr:hypothetical protein [Micromonospora sp. 4G55]